MMHSAGFWRPGSAIAPGGSTVEATLGRSTDERTFVFCSGYLTVSRQWMQVATRSWGFLPLIGPSDCDW